MGDNQSFLKNVIKGIQLRAKNMMGRKREVGTIGILNRIYFKHLPPNKLYSYKIAGKKVYFTNGAQFLHGIQEIFIEKVYSQSLPKNAFIIDCGAHIGLSVIYLKSICPSAKIVCFEPDKKNYEILLKNIESHKLENINPINKATWINNSEVLFEEAGDMSSKIIEGINSSKIKACRLYDFIDQSVDFLKIDIEGAEYEVLKDISSRLHNVKKLFVEYHGFFHQNQELLEILNMISEAGFSFYIKEAAQVYKEPFTLDRNFGIYDLQLNIFCIRLQSISGAH